MLVEQLSQALHSIIKTPSTPSIEHWPHTVLKYLSEQRVCSLPIIEYLVLIQHNTIQQSSTEMLALLNEYLLSVGVHEETPDAICQLLILISSCQYSHEVFQREVTSKIRNQLKQSKESECDRSFLPSSGLSKRGVFQETTLWLTSSCARG